MCACVCAKCDIYNIIYIYIYLYICIIYIYDMYIYLSKAVCAHSSCMFRLWTLVSWCFDAPVGNEPVGLAN